MKPVKNGLPYYQALYPVGSKLRWVVFAEDKSTVYNTETLVVMGMDTDCTSTCTDCDKRRYKGADGTTRCHYRKPESSFGLRYWERIE